MDVADAKNEEKAEGDPAHDRIIEIRVLEQLKRELVWLSTTS
jgi:hypothetical protein